MSRKISKGKKAWSKDWRKWGELSPKEQERTQLVYIGLPSSYSRIDELEWKKTAKGWKHRVPFKPAKVKKGWNPLRKGDRRFVVQFVFADAGGGSVDVMIRDVKLLRPAKKKDFAKLPSLCNNLHEDLSPWVVEYTPDVDDEDDPQPKPKPVKAVVNEEDLMKRKDHSIVFAGRACLDLSRQLISEASRCYSKAANMRE